MTKFLGNKRLLVLLLSLIVFTIVMGVTKGGREKLTWPEMFVKDSITWVQGLFWEPARHITGFFGDIRRLHLLFEENNALKESLSRYASDSARLKGLEAENERLRELLAFQKGRSGTIQYKLAEVVTRSPDRWNNMITIDLGSKHGIQKDMAVITPQGLVGKVHAVSHLFSNVQLITDMQEQSKVSALVRNKAGASFGIIESWDPESGLLQMKRIKLDDPVEVGDYVVTSGWGEVFPQGLMIGQVKSVAVGQYGLTKTAQIKPSADLYHLHEVLVVERTVQIPTQEEIQKEQEDADAAKEGAAEDGNAS